MAFIPEPPTTRSSTPGAGHHRAAGCGRSGRAGDRARRRVGPSLDAVAARNDRAGADRRGARAGRRRGTRRRPIAVVQDAGRGRTREDRQSEAPVDEPPVEDAIASRVDASVDALDEPVAGNRRGRPDRSGGRRDGGRRRDRGAHAEAEPRWPPTPTRRSPRRAADGAPRSERASRPRSKVFAAEIEVEAVDAEVEAPDAPPSAEVEVEVEPTIRSRGRDRIEIAPAAAEAEVVADERSADGRSRSKPTSEPRPRPSSRRRRRRRAAAVAGVAAVVDAAESPVAEALAAEAVVAPEVVEEPAVERSSPTVVEGTAAGRRPRRGGRRCRRSCPSPRSSSPMRSPKVAELGAAEVEPEPSKPRRRFLRAAKPEATEADEVDAAVDDEPATLFDVTSRSRGGAGGGSGSRRHRDRRVRAGGGAGRRRAGARVRGRGRRVERHVDRQAATAASVRQARKAGGRRAGDAVRVGLAARADAGGGAGARTRVRARGVGRARRRLRASADRRNRRRGSGGAGARARAELVQRCDRLADPSRQARARRRRAPAAREVVIPEIVGDPASRWATPPTAEPVIDLTADGARASDVEVVEASQPAPQPTFDLPRAHTRVRIKTVKTNGKRRWVVDVLVKQPDADDNRE